MEVLPLHVRGGNIFAIQYEARNTELTMQNNWCLLVALADDESSRGTLFMDDGDSQNTIEDGKFFEVRVSTDYSVI